MAFVLLLSTGCVISPRRTLGDTNPTPTPTATPTPTISPTPTPVSAVPTGKLYVSNSNDNSIFRFDNAFTATGNVAPAATISGGATTLSSPAFITLDSVNDRLFVANNGGAGVLIFDNISTKTGSIAPERTITGPLIAPTDVAVDTAKDLLYVVDDTEIYVFASASTATDPISPIHDITVSFAVSGIFIDSANDRLYVTDAAGNDVQVYNSASTQDGPPTVARTLQGANTQLSNPASILIDGLGRLIVTNGGNGGATAPSINIYANAATLNGNTAPSAQIKGAATLLSAPDQLALDITGTGTLYNADSGAAHVAAFTGLNTANGNVTPARVISGASTGLSVAGRPEGVAIDITR
ncbi:MAG TPA: hypothetical protein VHA06_06935 [Candidatus Angelobacter sp.]|nr:hypothetical protein [Candidatus Angelobacter sp.]